MQASGTFTFRHWRKNERAWKNKLKVAAAFFMEAIPLCLLLKKLQLFRLTEVYFNSNGYPYMYATCILYTPSSGTSIQKPYKGRYNKNLRGILVNVKQPN